jgi:hypothetical protein
VEESRLAICKLSLPHVRAPAFGIFAGLRSGRHGRYCTLTPHFHLISCPHTHWVSSAFGHINALFFSPSARFFPSILARCAIIGLARTLLVQYKSKCQPNRRFRLTAVNQAEKALMSDDTIDPLPPPILCLPRAIQVLNGQA